MEFIVAFNDKLMRRMVFYKSVPEEAFNYKQFRSTKSLIQKIVLEGCFKTKAVTGKKDVLKKSTLLLLLTNTKNSIAVWDKKSVLKIKKDTIINVKSELSSRSLYNFIKRWFFLFNPFLFENEISSFTGPKSIKKKVDSFKTIRLLNSSLLSSSNPLDFEITLKIVFDQEGSSEVFFNNYECD